MSEVTENHLWRLVIIGAIVIALAIVIGMTVYNVTDRIAPLRTWQTTLSK